MQYVIWSTLTKYQRAYFGYHLIKDQLLAPVLKRSLKLQKTDAGTKRKTANATETRRSSRH